MKMICDVPDEVIKLIKSGMWCGSNIATKIITNGIPFTKEEQALIQRWRDGRGISIEEFAEALDALQKPKSECEHDHEILKAHSDGASAVLESLIEQYEHYLELLDADMKDGSATIVTKTKYAVYTEVVEQLKEVLESEGEE